MSSKKDKPFNPAAKKKAKGHKPAHANTFAFVHNVNSRKTKKILAMPNVGLCRRCTEKIEWRKKYRKYKPLKAPAVCGICRQKEVKAAYHKWCGPCAAAKQSCPFCCLTWDAIKLKDQELLTNEAGGGEAGEVAGESDGEGSSGDEEHARSSTRGRRGGGGPAGRSAASVSAAAAAAATAGPGDWAELAPRLCLEVRAPWAGLLSVGAKTVEIRTYELPPGLVGAPLRLLETVYPESTEAAATRPPGGGGGGEPVLRGLPSLVPAGANPKGGRRENWEVGKSRLRTIPLF